MSHYINCKRTPNYKVAVKIADALQTSITYLLDAELTDEAEAEISEKKETFDKDFDIIISLITKHSLQMDKRQKMEIMSALIN